MPPGTGVAPVGKRDPPELPNIFGERRFSGGDVPIRGTSGGDGGRCARVERPDYAGDICTLYAHYDAKMASPPDVTP